MTRGNCTDWSSGELETRWDSFPIFSGWAAEQAELRWVFSLLYIRWIVGYSQIVISHLSTEYVLVPISATKEGVSYNPTGDTVEMAFMPNSVQQPGNADWMEASWETDDTNIIYPYSVKCLVGPSGVITLVPGNYVMFVKIFDSPETPVLLVGQLVVN
jgi:hypothetical protein